MKKSDFLVKLNFPEEWHRWDMYPQELFKIQLKLYKPGNETSSEHHRNGAFHWWISAKPNDEALLKLIFLSIRDADQIMAHDVREHIAHVPRLPKELRDFLRDYKRMEKRLTDALSVSQ